MKKILAIVISFVIIMSLVGCGSVDNSIHVNADNRDNLTNTTFGRSAMVEIGDCLWYDSSTRIVYWWNGSLGTYADFTTTPTPYYAPNGLPYRYNPETNTFEEIDIYVQN